MGLGMCWRAGVLLRLMFHISACYLLSSSALLLGFIEKIILVSLVPASVVAKV